MSAPNGEMASDQQSEALVDLQGRITEIWQRIEAAGGSRDSVKLVAVTKTHPHSLVALGLQAGLTDMGENRAQDLLSRNDALVDSFGLATSDLPRWHFIGGLQRNKVKQLAGRVSLWHSIDRDSLIAEVAKRDPGAEILLQVNTTNEAQKSGCAADEVGALIDAARELDLTVSGLMTLGPTGGGDPGPCFEQLRALGEKYALEHLSMGMSGDFELAVSSGATIVRLGSVLFGGRKPPSTGG